MPQGKEEEANSTRLVMGGGREGSSLHRLSAWSLGRAVSTYIDIRRGADVYSLPPILREFSQKEIECTSGDANDIEACRVGDVVFGGVMRVHFSFLQVLASILGVRGGPGAECASIRPS